MIERGPCLVEVIQAGGPDAPRRSIAIMGARLEQMMTEAIR